MSLSVYEARVRILAHLAVRLEQWREATTPYDLFPMYDSRQIEHLTYALGMLSTDVQSSRQSPTTGLPAITRIGLRWAYRLRADAMSLDYGLALGEEQRVLEALATIATESGDPQLRVRLLGATRRVVPTSDGSAAAALLVCDVQGEIMHHYPLS